MNRTASGNGTALLDRRRLLQGSGLALVLPALESLGAGQKTLGGTPRRLVCIGSHLGFHPANFFPADAGQGYTPTSTLKPLDKHRKNLTVFSHLDDGLSGGHRAVQGFLTGIRKEEAAGFPEKNISLDQAAAEHVGSATRFPVINTAIDGGTDMCWTRAGVHVPPLSNPSKLFQALFVNSSAQERKAQGARLSDRASTLDALVESAKALNATLGAADRNKLDQYLTSVRDVERRLQISQAWVDRAKPESPIAEVLDESRPQIDELALLYDLITLALQTDSTRVATLEIPMQFRTSELDLNSYHGISHHSKSEDRIGQLQVVESFFTTKLSDFMTGLSEAAIFDETLMVFGSGMGDASVHHNRDLPVLLAGGGLEHQGHLVCPAEKHERIPLSNLWLSVLQWFGAEVERFGRSTGTFSAMKIG